MHQRVSLHQFSLPSSSSLEDDLALTSRAGFSLIGLMEHKIARYTPAHVAELLGELDLTVSSLAHAPLFNVGVPTELPARLASLRDAVRLACRIGAPVVAGTPGGIGAADWATARRSAHRLAADIAATEAGGAQLLVEMALPLYAEYSFLHTLDDALAFVEDSTIGVVLDVFAVWTNRDLLTTIERGASAIRLCQLSDYRLGTRSLPARLVPGDGDIPLVGIVEAVLASGYSGVFELELQSQEVEREGYAAAAERAGTWVSDLLTRLGA